MIEEEKQEFKFLHSNDSDTVCLYLNIILEKYGKYVLIDYMIKNINKDKNFYLFSDHLSVNFNHIQIITGPGSKFFFTFYEDKFINFSEYYELTKIIEK